MIWWPHVVFAAALFLRVCRLNLARRLYASKVALWFQLDLKQVMIPTFQHSSCQHCSSFSLDHCHDTRPIWLCTFFRKNRKRPPLLPHPHTHTQALLYKPNLSNLNFDRFCGLNPFWPQCLCVSWCNVHSLCCSHGCCIATNHMSLWSVLLDEMHLQTWFVLQGKSSRTKYIAIPWEKVNVCPCRSPTPRKSWTNHQRSAQPSVCAILRRPVKSKAVQYRQSLSTEMCHIKVLHHWAPFRQNTTASPLTKGTLQKNNTWLWSMVIRPHTWFDTLLAPYHFATCAHRGMPRCEYWPIRPQNEISFWSAWALQSKRGSQIDACPHRGTFWQLVPRRFTWILWLQIVANACSTTSLVRPCEHANELWTPGFCTR